MSEFEPKTAVITGGASGIGLGLARSLGARGLKVMIADLPGDTLDAAAKEGFETQPCDVSDLAQVEALAEGVDSVVFRDFQPAERLPEVLASGDVHLIVLKAGLARSSVPSKLYSTLAAARPVLASIDPGTEISRVLAEQECGVAVPPDDVDAFEAALARLLDDDDARAVMGERGRAFVETWVSPSGVAAAYGRLFAELTPEKGSDGASVAPRG